MPPRVEVVLSMRAGTRQRTLKDHPAPGKTRRSRRPGLPVHAARLGHAGLAVTLRVYSTSFASTRQVSATGADAPRVEGVARRDASCCSVLCHQGPALVSARGWLRRVGLLPVVRFGLPVSLYIRFNSSAS